MSKNDLKIFWQDAHAIKQEDIYDKLDIRKTLEMNHSKMISKVLSDIKLKILSYSLILIIFVCLMIYALGYLGLNLSTNTLVLFAFVCLFILIKTTSEINRLLILTKTSNNLSVKASIQFFRNKMIRIKIIDFISYLFYFYSLAIWSTNNYIKDIGGIQNLSWGNAFQVLLLVFLLMLLLIPWLIKYQHNHRYRKLYSDLNDSTDFLHEAT